MSLFENVFGSPPSLNSVEFDASTYAYQGERNGAKVWFLTGGGGVGLYFFSKPPNLPLNISSVEELEKFYEKQLGPGQRMIEFGVVPLDEGRGISMITGEPMPQKRGMVYLGALTIPFAKFSYVIKIQCQETETTGIREALITDWALKNGKTKVQDGVLTLDGISTDNEQFDQVVTNHPLSRVRRELRKIVETTKIDQRINSQPRFKLP